MKCKILNTDLNNFMSFGKMPIANGFLNENEFKSEFFFEMKVGFSEKISLFQLLDHPRPEQMFNNTYPFFTSSSFLMKKHFQEYAKWVKKYLPSGGKLIEIGSNDGTYLQNFNNSNIDTLGIEPSKNVFEASIQKGVNALNNFFNTNIINAIPNFVKKTDVICAANVICHIPDLKNLIVTIDGLLNSNGVFIFEEPYLGSMYEKVSYDQIYDEHIYIFSASSIKKIFDLYDFVLIDVLPQTTHGGSLRYVVGRKGKHKINKSVSNFLENEKNLGLDSIEGCLKFKKKCEDSKTNLVQKLNSFKNDGKKIVGYAATSKSTTVLNYCNIGTETIEYICDTTKEKIGKFSPGKHIPIVSVDQFRNDQPDVVYLFAWNHKKEIFEKESAALKDQVWISHVEL